MKQTSLFIALILFVSIMTISSSCTNKAGRAIFVDSADSTAVDEVSEEPDTIAVERLTKTDTTRYASFSMKLELPTATEGVEGVIRKQLCDIVAERLSHVLSYEGSRKFSVLKDKDADNKTFFDYYFTHAAKVINADAKGDYDERAHWYNSDESLTDEQRKENLSTIPSWDYDYKLVKVADTLNYVVFLSQEYSYTGGAHGGVGGDGDLTFSKLDGKMIEHFVDTTKVEALQPLLREGLKSYFAENGEKLTDEELYGQLQLGISGNERTIPLPMYQPFPTAEGLVFTYQQYEVACYAAGMPSFVIPYKKIARYLTPEATKLLKPLPTSPRGRRSNEKKLLIEN